jgi:hypothetical protein
LITSEESGALGSPVVSDATPKKSEHREPARSGCADCGQLLVLGAVVLHGVLARRAVGG